MMRALIVLMLTMGLVACGETDQSLVASAKKPDSKPWQAAPGPYTVKGWSAGDKTSWETQLRTRAQTQNEYAKVD
jgi:hypothetical protein